jgi:hypothetical protein
MRLVLLFVLATLVGGSTASADYVLSNETRDLRSDPPEVTTTLLYLGKDKFAADSRSAEGEHTTTIYDAAENVIYHVEHDSKSYMRIDQATLDQVGTRMNDAMQQMREQMAQMPEAQRKQVEQMMQSMGGDAHQVEWTVKDTGDKETLAGHGCRRYELLADGEKQSDVWAAPWKDAGLPKESFEVLRKFSTFFQNMASANPLFARAMKSQGGALQGLDRIEGFPVRVVDYDDGKVSTETTTKSYEEKKVDPSMYQVPAGYTRKGFDE